MARKSTRRTIARVAIPTICHERAHPAVRSLLKSSVGVSEFFASAEALSRSQQTRIIDQAIMMLEGFYAHLPLKRAMYALDPLQRLRLLRQRLHTFNSAASFHREMTSIFTSLHDLHTNYCLPAPFKDANASLPFKVESYCGIHPGGDPACAPEHRRYLVTTVADWFHHPSFRRGVELLYWNGIPIARAVEIAAAQSAGGNGTLLWAHGTDRWLILRSFQPAKGEKAEQFTPERCVELARRAVGIPDLHIELVNIAFWTRAAQVAERFQD